MSEGTPGPKRMAALSRVWVESDGRWTAEIKRWNGKHIWCVEASESAARSAALREVDALNQRGK